MQSSHLKSAIKLVILLGLILIISIALIFNSIRVNKDAIFLVRKNTSSREIARQMADAKIIDNQVGLFLFSKLYSKLYGKYIIAGEYQLRAGLDAIDLMKILTGGKVIQHSLSVPEGLTVKQVIARIEELNNIEHFPDKLYEIEEGSIMPDTYFYTYGALDMELIKRMQSAMTGFIAVEWPKRDIRIDKFICSPDEAIILASIVEKETYIDSERPMIAGVYLNRLKKKMKLQACPTVIYGLNLVDNPKWDKRLRYSHLKSQSEYNTYLNDGLPPKPICNPGRKSISAVLHPKWTNKLFFVSKGEGKHLFASDFEEHKSNIKRVSER